MNRIMKEKVKELVKEIGISEFENFLKEFKQEGSYLDNYQSAKEWFNSIVKETSIHKHEKFPDSLFFVYDDGMIVMEQDFKGRHLWVRYNQHWAVLRSRYKLNDPDIRFLIQEIIEKHFKIEVGQPCYTSGLRWEYKFLNK